MYLSCISYASLMYMLCISYQIYVSSVPNVNNKRIHLKVKWRTGNKSVADVIFNLLVL